MPRRLSVGVGQEVGDAAAFEITDNGAVALPAFPGEVVDADNTGR
jgi:hypothetical protein